MTRLDVLEYKLKAQKNRLSYLKSVGFSEEQLEEQLMKIKKTEDEINSYYDEMFA